MRAIVASVILLSLIGCNRLRPVPLTEAAAGNYDVRGPIGLSIESVRNGKVRMSGMMGRMGESKEVVFTIQTRFKLLDTSVPVKQFALQRDGTMLGGGSLKLKDETGREFKAVGGFGFDAVKGRRSDTAILTAENLEATDQLTFESVADAQGDLILEVPANYQLQQPDGTFLQPKEPGTFRFRIPQEMWSALPPTTEAGRDSWATIGPVSVAVESVRVGKVMLVPWKPGEKPTTAESKSEVFAITIRVKLADLKAHIKKPPYIVDGSFGGSQAKLHNAQGENFPAFTDFQWDRVIGRQNGDVELSAKQPELVELLTFDAKAATSEELFLTFWPYWQERNADGTWSDAKHEGEFRFRIPKVMWAK